MNNLKSLFAYSSDNVIITDYNFNILWANRKDDFFSSYGDNCSKLFAGENLPLKSDSYFVKHNGLYYKLKVINYPNCQSGIYVIQSSGNDVIYSFVNCKPIKKIIYNQSGEIREAVSGISISSNILKEILAGAEKYSEQKYIDISLGNCRKILKSLMNITELIDYSVSKTEKVKINLSAFLEDFVVQSEDVLKGKIEIFKEAEPELYISADTNRLETFLLSMLILTNGRNPKNNIINIKAEYIDNYVSITFSPDSSGTDNSEKIFTDHARMYKNDEINPELLIIKRFCKIFNGTLLITRSENEITSYNVRLPFDNTPTDIILNTSVQEYGKDTFSKYYITLSEIMY